MVSIHGPLGYGPSTLPLRHSAVCLRGAFQMCILLASHIRVEVIEFPAYGWCNRCAIQYLQSRLSPMHLDAKLSLQHPKNKENSFGHRKLKFCAYSMLLVTNNTKMVCCSKTTNSKKISSPAGNRTPVSRVTGGDTYHYTTEDTSASSRDWIKYIWVNWGELRTLK